MKVRGGHLKHLWNELIDKSKRSVDYEDKNLVWPHTITNFHCCFEFEYCQSDNCKLVLWDICRDLMLEILSLFHCIVLFNNLLTIWMMDLSVSHKNHGVGKLCPIVIHGSRFMTSISNNTTHGKLWDIIWLHLSNKNILWYYFIFKALVNSRDMFWSVSPSMLSFETSLMVWGKCI